MRVEVRAAGPHLAFVALVVYALHGVGVCCDDLPQIALRTGAAPVEEWLATPVLIATHGWLYRALGYANFAAYDAVKIAWTLLAYAMASRFASLWLPPFRAGLFAALFVLYPSHDSTVFWFSNQYLMLTSAFYLFAFHLAERGRLAGATSMALLGSFVSYGSPPWAAGLAVPFLLQRRWKAAAALLVPQAAYVAYYVALTEFAGIGSKRLPGAWDFAAIARAGLLQLAGALDAVAGPSFALKLFWSIASIGLVSALFGLAIFLLLASNSKGVEKKAIPLPVWAGAGVVVLCGLGMFALTGFYPQAAFGLGNRVTIYASFPAALALAALPASRTALTAIGAALVFATLGVADHWRDWRRSTDEAMQAIRANPELRRDGFAGGVLFVTGHDYSRLGPVGHIAFLTETWMADAAFELALGARPPYKVVPLAARYELRPGGLFDPKYGATYPVGDHVDVYDADANTLRRVERASLAGYIAGLRAPPRHWIQLVDAPGLSAAVARWMPRLAYLFPARARVESRPGERP